MTAQDGVQSDPRHIRVVVAAAYAEALGLAVVDPTATFFDLGGDSILLAIVRNKLREELPDVEFGLLDLFQHPSVEALTHHLTRAA